MSHSRVFKNKSNDITSRVIRLLSKTTDYFPNMIYLKGNENVVANVLSRLPNHEYVSTRGALLRKKTAVKDENSDNDQIQDNKFHKTDKSIRDKQSNNDGAPQIKPYKS